MKHEAGPHRVQRVPVTETQGRIHTSSATVTVLPEAEEVDVDIDANDLQVDVYRSSGPGGQSVNTTDSAVRSHAQADRARRVDAGREEPDPEPGQGAAGAARRLLKLEQDRQAAEASEARRDQIGGGGRSEKIRTYNFKENRVTDHRIGLTLYKLDKVLAGELDEVSDALVPTSRPAGSPSLSGRGRATWRRAARERASRGSSTPAIDDAAATRGGSSRRRRGTRVPTRCCTSTTAATALQRRAFADRWSIGACAASRSSTCSVAGVSAPSTCSSTAAC